MNELSVFDELVANITVFVAPTKQVKVIDPVSNHLAIGVAKQIKSYGSAVEKLRKELVGPLNEKVNEINARCKMIMAPLNDADLHVRSELNKYANEKEQIKQSKIREIAEERKKSERAEIEARVKAAYELKAKQIEENEAAAVGASLFGEDEEETESTTERNERERLELEAKFDQERNLAEIARKQAEYDAAQTQVKNTRKNYKCEAYDLTKVPREYLVITLNTSMVIAAAKGGVKDIPGVRIWTEMAVAIGSNTRGPSIGQ